MTKPENGKHIVCIEDRQRITLEGVKEVSGFSDTSISLKTTRGALVICGKSLNISKFNDDTGELFITGEANMLRYSKDKSKRSLFEGLLK